MDVATIVTAVASSLGLSVPAAGWLSQKLIGHRLEKDLTVFKADVDADHKVRQAALDADYKARQASLDGDIRQHVETVLGELAADREYSLEARKRLYSAIGPLRFQLLLACRDLAGRLAARGDAARESYSTAISGYYGRSTLYRILRPLCLSELIERQIAYADFSVDPGAVDLLRFKKGAFEAFAGSVLVAGHPRVRWDSQVEHVFVDNVSKCASALIKDGEQRPLRFHEFEEFLQEPGNVVRVAPFPDLLQTMSPGSTPLLWLRLVAYGALCNDFIDKAGSAIGFGSQPYPLRDLLMATGDDTMDAHIDEYVGRCESLMRVTL